MKIRNLQPKMLFCSFLMTWTLSSACVSNEYHAFLIFLWHCEWLWVTQKTLSCQEFLLLTITCTVSACVRRQMPCSLLTPPSGHLFHHSSKTLGSVSFQANFVCCVLFDPASRPYPRTPKDKHYLQYDWKGCLQGVFEWNMRETKCW